MTIRNKSDFTASTVLLCFCSLLFWETYNIDMSIVYALGSQFFPRSITVFMLLMSAILFIKSIDFTGTPKSGEIAVKKPRPKEVWLQLGAVGLLALYLWVLPRIGYVPSTVVFVFITIFMLGPKTKKDIATYLLVALFVAFFLQYIFGSVLKLFLP